jgi:hypothetical protein
MIRQLLCVVALFTSLPILICPKIFATVRTYPAPAVLIVKRFLANLAWLERQRIPLAIPFIERRLLGFSHTLQLCRTIASAIFLVTRFKKYLAAFALRLFRRRLPRIIAREHLRLDTFVFFRRPRRSAGALLDSAYRINAFAIACCQACLILFLTSARQSAQYSGPPLRSGNTLPQPGRAHCLILVGDLLT